MPVHYSISPELNMIIYVCRRLITGSEIFAAADAVFVDKRRCPGMITIIDLLSAVENFYVEDLYATTRRIDKAADEGFVPGPIVLLSLSKGIHIWANTLNLLPSRVPFRIEAFHTMQDAIVSLGLFESREKIIQFWNECNSLCAGS